MLFSQSTDAVGSTRELRAGRGEGGEMYGVLGIGRAAVDRVVIAQHATMLPAFLEELEHDGFRGIRRIHINIGKNPGGSGNGESSATLEVILRQSLVHAL